jgi:two-component system, NarL family, response regulator LiaR
MKIYIYGDDINLISYLETNITAVELAVLYSVEEVLDLDNSFLMLDISSLKKDAEDIIKTILGQNNKIFLLDRIPNIQKAKKYLSLNVQGYANALMHGSLFEYAIKIINDGMVWLHPDLISNLIFEIPSTNTDNNSNLDILTAREKEVANLILEGSTYKQIAQSLDITIRTVKAHAQSIFNKFQVKDRLALALYLK